MKTIAFTGHRPKDLGGLRYQAFADALDVLIHGRTDIQFVVGGALGVDTWAAEYAMSRGISFTLITPFTISTMARFWSEIQTARLVSSAVHATNHIIINDGAYDVRSYDLRNHAMVDLADVVFAVYTGKRGGGTYNCIKYALAQGKPVYNMLPNLGKLRPITSI
jgi:uncharacterized phage-like protein YoqJ